MQSANDAKLAEIENILQDKFFQLRKQINDLSISVDQKHRSLWHSAAVYNQHQKIFSKYRGIHKGKDIVLLATGATLNYYSVKEKKGCYYITVNKGLLRDEIASVADYWFASDYVNGLGELKYKIADIFCPKAKKFIGVGRLFGASEQAQQFLQFPIKFIEDANADFFYYTDSLIPTYDPSTMPFTSYASVVFLALQFIAYTHPKRLFVVGCDCGGGHFDDPKDISNVAAGALVKHWQVMKQFFDTWYPDTEIISVNPVGLKGLFHDVYTESYLNDHPEIDRKTVEILQQEE